MPAGQGLWPAFCMMGADIDQNPWPGNGEIDVMEALGNEPGTVHGTAHAPGFEDQGLGGSHRLPSGARLSDAFHTYAVEWSPTRIDWYLDGDRYFSLGKGDLKPGQHWVFDQPFYLLLDLAVGGDWPGAPDGITPFPSALLVDYVRVYSRA